MKLDDLIENYVQYKRSLGMHYRTDANILQAYCRAMGNIAVDDVKPESVSEFIAGNGPVTSYWRLKFSILSSLYRYAQGRGFATMSPLPTTRPKLPPPQAPYIYSVNELKRLLTATATLKTPTLPLLAASMRTLLLLLYGTGMRISEALNLTLQDVDLTQQLLTVRDTKFFKSRLVPIGPRLTNVLMEYELRRRQLPLPNGDQAAFFASRNGQHWQAQSVRRSFNRLRQVAGIRRDDVGHFQPRVHDLRHTTAVHRLITWYKSGLDVQHLLPQLATYLGHAKLSYTQRYLTMTLELLHEASLRFEQYVNQEVHHE